MVEVYHIDRDEQPLIDYLLGRLPADALEPFEEASIVDDDLAARLARAENDLVDAYLTGALRGELRHDFEAVYFSSPVRRRKLEQAQRFREAMMLPAIEAPGAASWRARLALPAVTAAACAMLASGTLVWQLGSVSRHEAVAHAGEPLLLTPELRSAELMPTVVAGAGSGPLVFNLRLESDDFAVYRATLLDAQTNPVWRSGDLFPVRSAASASVTMGLSASLLTPQHYSLQLSGVSDSGESPVVGSYAFEVIPR